MRQKREGKIQREAYNQEEMNLEYFASKNNIKYVLKPDFKKKNQSKTQQLQTERTVIKHFFPTTS